MPFKDKLRLIANFGKYPVVRVMSGLTGVKFHIQLPHGIILEADLPVKADIQVGDLLTLYTEVLADEEPRSH